METLFTALAQAIVAVVINDLAKQPRLQGLRDKLGRNGPETLALQRALLRTYTDFQQKYPSLAASLLDETYLGLPVVAHELAQLLTPERTPNPNILIQAWHAQLPDLPTQDLREPIDLLLVQLQGYIKDESALKPFVDSRAFEQLYAIAQHGADQVEAQQIGNKILADIRTLLHQLVAQPPPQASDEPKPSTLPPSLSNNLLTPFGDTRRINEPTRFFVRPQIMREVQELLQHGNSVFLGGPLESGKSSLLYYLHQTGKTWLPNKPVIYIDMHGVINETDFCHELLGLLEEPPGDLRMLRRVLQRYTPLLLLDEVVRLTNLDTRQRLQSLLRSLCEDETLVLLVASQYPMQEVFPRSDPRTSPLYNVFTEYELTPFSLQEVISFIDQRLHGTGVDFHPDEVAELHQQSQGNPAQLQQMAQQLYARKLAR